MGNQLFQYAFGRKVSIQNKEKLFFDVSSYKNDYLGRKVSLSGFNLKGKIISNNWLQKIITHGTKLNVAFKRLGLLNENHEMEFDYKKAYLITKKQLSYYSGYWQSYKYFEDIRENILKEISLGDKKMDFIKRKVGINSSSVAIHVRRTDYLNQSGYGFLGPQYYLNCLKLINEKVTNPHYTIFSDDVEWCRNNLNLKETATYISKEFGLSDVEELLLMSECAHHIIANSSFSWWGAWLCKHPDQIVMRPAKPFNDCSLLYQSHYPQNWIPVE